MDKTNRPGRDVGADQLVFKALVFQAQAASGGIGETLHIIAPFLAKRCVRERQSRC